MVTNRKVGMSEAQWIADDEDILPDRDVLLLENLRGSEVRVRRPLLLDVWIADDQWRDIDRQDIHMRIGMLAPLGIPTYDKGHSPDLAIGWPSLPLTFIESTTRVALFRLSASS